MNPAGDEVGVSMVVTGRVQGVFFRKSTCTQARQLGLCGWVANLATGQVAVEAFGSRDAVEALVAFCKVGPPAAQVEALEVEWLRVQPNNPKGFHIRYSRAF